MSQKVPGHAAGRDGSLWDYVHLLVGVAIVLTCAAFTLYAWPRTTAELAPTSGTIVGFRFSGDFAYRCQMWIKPTGGVLYERVLLDPNSEAECVNARIGDAWERVR